MKGVTVVRLNYRADPEKADPKWAETMKIGVPSDKWAREFEMDANAGLGMSIYGREYKPAIHERQLTPIAWAPMGHGMDFGRGCPAHAWVQRTPFNGVRVLAEQFGEDIQLRLFLARLIAFEINTLGGPFHNRRDYVDPAGNQPKDDGMKSVEVMREFGWHPQWRGSEYSERHEYVSLLLTSQQEDGEPMFLIDPVRCPKLCEAFRSRYRRDKQGHPERVHPYTDLMNALEYYLMNTKTPRRPAPPAPDYRLINEFSGYGPWGSANAAFGQGEDRMVFDPAGATARYERAHTRRDSA